MVIADPADRSQASAPDRVRDAGLIPGLELDRAQYPTERRLGRRVNQWAEILVAPTGQRALRTNGIGACAVGR